jgi:RHS repeat-associated protein
MAQAGNARITYRDGINKVDNTGNTALNDGTIVSADMMQINHYYPFGMNMEGNWNGPGGKNKYQYNEKELNSDFGLDWNDYGARFYDAAIARWVAVDPSSQRYSAWSPYNYCKNNPINLIDPDGMDVDDPKLKGGSQTVSGGIIENSAASYSVLVETTTSVATESIKNTDGAVIGQREIKTTLTATDLISKDGTIANVPTVNVTTTSTETYKDGRSGNSTTASKEISRTEYDKSNNSSLGKLSSGLSAYAKENKSHYLSNHFSAVADFKFRSSLNFSIQGLAAGFFGKTALAALTEGISTKYLLTGSALLYVADKIFNIPLNTDGLNGAIDKISISDSVIAKVKAWGADSQVHFERTNVNVPVIKK